MGVEAVYRRAFTGSPEICTLWDKYNKEKAANPEPCRRAATCAWKLSPIS